MSERARKGEMCQVRMPGWPTRTSVAVMEFTVEDIGRGWVDISQVRCVIYEDVYTEVEHVFTLGEVAR
jgi:hypothetical protein